MMRALQRMLLKAPVANPEIKRMAPGVSRFSPGLCDELFSLRDKHPDMLFSEKYQYGLKQFGALYVIDWFRQFKPKRVLEMGAGNSVLFDHRIGDQCEYWMVDDSGFYQEEQFQTSLTKRNHTKFVNGLVGEDLPNLPENYFDLIFSVSVLEHVTRDKVTEVARHMRRLLAPGGRLVHSIDIPANRVKDRPVFWHRALDDAGIGSPAPPTTLDFGDTVEGAVILEPFHIVNDFYGKAGYAENPTQPDWYQSTYIIDAGLKS